MKLIGHLSRWGAVAAITALALPLNLSAELADYRALKSQVEALQHQLRQVQETLKQYEDTSASKEEVQDLKREVAEVSGTHSEWKNADSVVYLAGYGDVTYLDSDK